MTSRIKMILIDRVVVSDVQWVSYQVLDSFDHGV